MVNGLFIVTCTRYGEIHFLHTADQDYSYTSAQWPQLVVCTEQPTQSICKIPHSYQKCTQYSKCDLTNGLHSCQLLYSLRFPKASTPNAFLTDHTNHLTLYNQRAFAHPRSLFCNTWQGSSIYCARPTLAWHNKVQHFTSAQKTVPKLVSGTIHCS